MGRCHLGLLLGFLALLGCGDRVTALAPPPLDDALSLLIGVETEDTSISLFAVDLQAPSFSIPEPKGDRVTLFALPYEASLEQLGLRAGLQRIDNVETREAPTPTRAFRADILKGMASAWAEQPVRELDLSRFLVPGSVAQTCESRKARFTVKSFELETKANGTFAIALDDQTALLATLDGHFYEVRPSGVTGVALNPAPPSGAAFVDQTGTAWLAGRNGALWRGTYEGGFSLVSTSSTGQLIRWMAGDPSGKELFMLGFSGFVERFNTQRGEWTTLATGDDVFVGGVTWLGPGEAVFARHTLDHLLRVKDGIRSRVNPGAGALGLTTVANIPNIPGVGLVAGVVTGAVHGEVNGRWNRLGGLSFAVPLSMLPYEDGFLVGGADGFLGQYYPGVGFCEDRLAPGRVVQLLAMGAEGKDLLLVQQNINPEMMDENSPLTSVTWLTRN